MAYTEAGKMNKYDAGSLFSTGKPEKKMLDWTKLIEDKSFKRIRIEGVKDVWVAFRKLFGGRTDV